MASKVAPDLTGANEAAESRPQESRSLRRAVGVWGSYTWGYADVGADGYVALGIVMVAAQGATNFAFLFAGLERHWQRLLDARAGGYCQLKEVAVRIP